MNAAHTSSVQYMLQSLPMDRVGYNRYTLRYLEIHPEKPRQTYPVMYVYADEWGCLCFCCISIL